MVEGAIRPLEARTDHSDLGMPLEDGDDGVERPGGHRGIRIEREEVGSVPPPRSEIGRRREAEVAGRCDQVDLGELRGDHLRRSVRRRVVDDDHGHRARGRVRAQRAEAFAEELPRSVGHDHDVECGVAAHLSRPGSAGMLISRGRKRLGRLRPVV